MSFLPRPGPGHDVGTYKFPNNLGPPLLPADRINNRIFEYIIQIFDKYNIILDIYLPSTIHNEIESKVDVIENGDDFYCELKLVKETLHMYIITYSGPLSTEERLFYPSPEENLTEIENILWENYFKEKFGFIY